MRAAPFVAWAWWTRKGSGVLGIGSADAGAALAVGLGVAFACIAMLGRWSAAFWSVPGTWWALAAMLGVGVSEELVFRGCLLGGLARRLSRARAEWWSAAGFAVFHLPHHLAVGMPPGDIAVSLALLLVWGWCYAFAMRTGRHVPGLALVHAITNVGGET
ncbi:MAG: CPBP family intramembrane glutamic endopeptidase [Planctomycetota bacterium]